MCQCCLSEVTEIKATCTGCLLPACALAQAPAHSPSLAEGCGSWGGGAGVSFPPILSDVEQRAPTGEGPGRGWCGRLGGSLAGRQRWDWSWRWWSWRKGADCSCEPGCSEPSWAQSSTDEGRTGREQPLRKDKMKVDAGFVDPKNELQHIITLKQ